MSSNEIIVPSKFNDQISSLENALLEKFGHEMIIADNNIIYLSKHKLKNINEIREFINNFQVNNDEEETLAEINRNNEYMENELTCNKFVELLMDDDQEGIKEFRIKRKKIKDKYSKSKKDKDNNGHRNNDKDKNDKGRHNNDKS